MKSVTASRATTLGVGAALLAALCLSAVAQNASPPGEALPAAIKLKVTNRLHPNYLEYFTTEIGDTNQIGDSDFFFVVTEFYAHFAMIDSTKEVVSLSEEPKNPAFRITVLENDEVADQTWAFYSVRIPHFGRTSYMAFDVMEFDYKGEHFTNQIEGNSPESG